MSQSASIKGNEDSLAMCRALTTQSQGSIEPIETSALGLQSPLGDHSLIQTACDRLQAIAAMSIPAYSQRNVMWQLCLQKVPFSGCISARDRSCPMQNLSSALVFACSNVLGWRERGPGSASEVEAIRLRPNLRVGLPGAEMQPHPSDNTN